MGCQFSQFAFLQRFCTDEHQECKLSVPADAQHMVSTISMSRDLIESMGLELQLKRRQTQRSTEEIRHYISKCRDTGMAMSTSVT